MKFPNIWLGVAGIVIAMGCVSCGSGGDAAVESGSAPASNASVTLDTEVIAAWYVKARQ